MEIQASAINIVNKLARHGYIAYFAGGWVRDLILGHPSEDIDIATNAPVEVILDLFPRTILVGLNFGVVVVAMDGHQFEVSTFRRDVEYINGRKPERIEKASPQEDALRRDFTINGMFYDPIENVIHDYVQGMEDIKKKVIRTIGDPQERFVEDRLRMIRAFRFAARFEFTITLETQEAIEENADTLFPSVAIERVWQEFCKMSAYSHFDQALIEMHRLKLLPVIFPSLAKVHLTDLKKRVRPLNRYPKRFPTVLFLLELFPDASGQELFALCRYLKIPVKDQKLLEFFYQSREKFLRNSDKGLELVDWARFYAHNESELFIQIALIHLEKDEAIQFKEKHVARQTLLASHVQRLKDKTPLISSAALKEEGISPGKQMGLLLKEAEDYAINHDTENVAEVIHHLKQSINWPKS
ncbi:CCA-adding enzyme [Chlamydiales bacterium STE3]|nr:CCA-adding enzyme [Chlamydiales bacterium STE3]